MGCRCAVRQSKGRVEKQNSDIKDLWQIQCESKNQPHKTFFRCFRSCWTCVFEKCLDYCPTICLHLYQFWSIYRYL